MRQLKNVTYRLKTSPLKEKYLLTIQPFQALPMIEMNFSMDIKKYTRQQARRNLTHQFLK